jgi:hypothetical protein
MQRAKHTDKTAQMRLGMGNPSVSSILRSNLDAFSIKNLYRPAKVVKITAFYA